jgi:hypothetical protein
MIGSKYLTGETAAQEITWPGQAHFAIPGAKRKCRDCAFWALRYKDDKRAICSKAAMLTPRKQTQRIPAYATICKYFEER